MSLFESHYGRPVILVTKAILTVNALWQVEYSNIRSTDCIDRVEKFRVLVRRGDTVDSKTLHDYDLDKCIQFQDFQGQGCANNRLKRGHDQRIKNLTILKVSSIIDHDVLSVAK